MTASLETEIAQRRMIVGTAAKRPVVLTITLVDWSVVDASYARTHQAVFVEPRIAVRFAFEWHDDSGHGRGRDAGHEALRSGFGRGGLTPRQLVPSAKLES